MASLITPALKAKIWTVSGYLLYSLAPLPGFAEPVELGSDRQLFVDAALIDELHHAALVPGRPTEAGMALQLDQPWEGGYAGYFTVLHDGSRFQLYYRGKAHAGGDGNDEEVTCYAESSDGMHWIRPDLGLHTVFGTKKNNVILAGIAPYSHNFSPFLDSRPGVPAVERYKAVAGIQVKPPADPSGGGLVGFVSADGIHWRKIRDQPVITSSDKSAFDSQNVVFWSEREKVYVCYARTWKAVAGKRYRWISRATSRDFLEWTPLVEMDYGDTPPEHLYTNQTSPYFRAPNFYIALGARFVPNRHVLSPEHVQSLKLGAARQINECSDAILMTSRGGQHYDRTFLESFLRPGLGLENWVSRTNYPALNVVQTGATEMSWYVQRHYAQPSHALVRYTLRLDGFASVRAPFGGGTLTTQPFRFRGSHLEINYSTSSAGGLQIEVQDEHGAALPGYAVADCKEIVGDEIMRVVQWKAGPDVAALAGRTVRLKFFLKDADLYSFRFTE